MQNSDAHPILARDYTQLHEEVMRHGPQSEDEQEGLEDRCILQGVGSVALASAMRVNDLAMLSEAVRDLRSRGDDVEALYRAVHPRFPGAPTLAEVETRPSARTGT